MPRRPLISLALPVHGTSFAHALAVARAAESAGFDGVWVPDHLLNLTRPQAGVLECWTVLAAVAAVTERVGVGSLVIATPFRHPPLLAKQLATLDSIAPGRLTLGLGAGGFTYDEACKQLGFKRLSPAERVADVEETIACVRRLLADDPAEFHGRFARADGARVFPRPSRAVPIVVAAERPRMLRLTARLGDGWNCPRPQALEAGRAALQRYGRDPASIQVSAYVVAFIAESDDAARRALARAGESAQLFGDVRRHHICGGPQTVVERIRDFARRGADHLVLDLRGRPRTEAIEILARDVLPHFGS